MNIPKEREAEILAWFEEHQDENGTVHIPHDGTMNVPPEIFGLTREQIKDIPKLKIGARVSQAMVDRLEKLKQPIDN